jgi:hypothetical protein
MDFKNFQKYISILGGIIICLTLISAERPNIIIEIHNVSQLVNDEGFITSYVDTYYQYSVFYNCSGAEVGLGNGTCINQSVFFDDTDTNITDTSAYVNCSGMETFLGNGSCQNLSIYLDDTTIPDTNCSINGSCDTIVYWDNESVLNTNSSNWWDNYNTANVTQFDNVGGVLHLLDSWLTTFFNIMFGTKSTDDLSEGSSNFYDNRSWNQSLADTLYVDTNITDTSAYVNCSGAEIFYGNGSCGNTSVFFDDTDTDTYYISDQQSELNETGTPLFNNLNLTNNLTMNQEMFICLNSTTCDQWIKANASGVYIQG